MKEIFKDIEYKGLKINVSNYGKIIWNGNIRKPYYNKDGYLVCSLKIPHKGWRSVGVHILVAIAFIPNPQNLPEVNHKDYNRANPRFDNLEWITRKDNIRYSICNRKDYNGLNNPNYGNRTLSKKYKKDKKLAKEKQGRPGIKNGRCIPIDLYYDNKFVKHFDYITLCCEYLINNNISDSKNINTVKGQIYKSIKNNNLFKNHYSFIKKE